jgi:UDP-N-acetylglucosamine--N-acetylmuramyl-(pentapeptide) pyrophosphoryl-undecaprenol N-acetylglucosamine transferase
MSARSGCIIFAGGGTGGHIFPALAIAEELLERKPGVRCSFLTSTRPLDAQLMHTQQLAGSAPDFEPIPAMPFGARPRALYRFLTRWGLGVRTARAHIRARRGEDRSPCILVAMGGFVAAPAAQAARAERVPIVLVNLDAFPGRANRWIAERAGVAITSAPVPDKGWVRVPPIVRRGAAPEGGKALHRASLGLDPTCSTLLVTGGSQGAGSINSFLSLFVRTHAEALRGWQLIHQTGSERDALECAQVYAEAGLRALVRPFFEPIGPCWASSDLTVCRAGAGNVAEAWANRVPALFMPYPYHRDEHQRLNAEMLSRVGAASLARDQVDPQSNMGDAGEILRQLVTTPERRETMYRALVNLGPTDGAAHIADRILALLGGC